MNLILQDDLLRYIVHFLNRIRFIYLKAVDLVCLLIIRYILIQYKLSLLSG